VRCAVSEEKKKKKKESNMDNTWTTHVTWDVLDVTPTTRQSPRNILLRPGHVRCVPCIRDWIRSLMTSLGYDPARLWQRLSARNLERDHSVSSWCGHGVSVQPDRSRKVVCWGRMIDTKPELRAPFLNVLMTGQAPTTYVSDGERVWIDNGRR
jgi:hypothetical protein